MKEGWNVPMNHVLRLLKSPLMEEMVEEAKRIMSRKPSPPASVREEEEDLFLIEAVLEHEQFHAQREFNARKNQSGPNMTSTPTGTSVNVRKRSLPLSSPPSLSSQRGKKSGGSSPSLNTSGKAAEAGRKNPAGQSQQQQQRVQTPTTFPLPVGKAAVASGRSSSTASSSDASVNSRSDPAVKRQKKAPAQLRVKLGQSSAVGGRIKNPLLRRSVQTSQIDDDLGEECSDFTE